MNERKYTLEGMDCADCAVKIENGVRKIGGVEGVTVNFVTGQLLVSGSATDAEIRQRVERLGYTVQAVDAPVSARPIHFWGYLMRRGETRLALVGGALLIVSLAAGWLGTPHALVMGLQILALAVAGAPTLRSGLVNLWINRNISIDLLMTIAAIGALVIGQTAESATLIFLFAISEALEGYSADKARHVLGEIRDLSPSHAVRLLRAQDSGWGGEERVLVSDLQVGDTILVSPGERIPTDGRVEMGSSAVLQAAVTGESLPVNKQPGDSVFGGTVNGESALHIQVTRLSSDSTIQRIIQLIEQAQSLRAPTQRFIDRFAQIYTPAVVGLAVLLALVPPLLFGQPFWNTPQELGWLYRALALLVIACPCALVISAPVTVVSAITAGARHGVLFKGGAFLEALADMRVFAFDKTGTLTTGKPVVTTLRAVDCALLESPAACSHCDDLLALASALEHNSTHPLARSVVSAASERGLDGRYAPAGDVITLAGSGLQGHVNGKLATVGSHAFFDRAHPHAEDLCGWVRDAEQSGQTTMLVCDGDRVRGFIALADTIRPSSQAVIRQLHAAGKQTALLTGDNITTAATIARQAGIDMVQAGLLPEEKVQALQTLHQQHGAVAMVGDGINDAPALAAADLGIAVGGASSAQAMETADIVLMGGDLQQLPFAIQLSAFARRIIRQNITISLGVKAIFLLLAVFGLTSLWLAVLADVGVSLAVTANGLRANRFSGHLKATAAQPSGD